MSFKYEVQMFRSEDLHQWNYNNLVTQDFIRVVSNGNIMNIHVLIIRVEFWSTRKESESWIVRGEVGGLVDSGVGREGWSRMGFHVGLIWRPQSRFIVEACCWMYNASVTRLSQVYGTDATTLAESQSTLCSLLHAWTAMPFFMSCFRTAYLGCYSLLQGSASFANVHCLTVSTRNFVDHTFLSVSWCAVLNLDQWLS